MGDRYPAIIKLWQNAWAEFVPFLAYSPEIRRVTAKPGRRFGVTCHRGRWHEMDAGRILVCEDHAVLRELFCSLLADAGYEVCAAPSGSACVVRAVVWRPDLVVLDLTLPDRDGLDVLRTLRAGPQTPHTPVLVLSGADDRRSAANAAGADEFLLKPVTSAELLNAVHDQFARDPPAAPSQSGASGTARTTIR